MDQMEHFYNDQGPCFLYIAWRSSVLLLPLKKISLSCLPMNFVLAFLNLLPYLMAYLVSWNNKLYFYLCNMFYHPLLLLFLKWLFNLAVTFE